MNTFFITLQIVAGILSPIIFLGFMWLIARVVELAIDAGKVRLEKARKKPPYDGIESSVSLHDGTLHIQLVKRGKVVFGEEIPKKELM